LESNPKLYDEISEKLVEKLNGIYGKAEAKHEQKLDKEIGKQESTKLKLMSTI